MFSVGDNVRRNDGSKFSWKGTVIGLVTSLEGEERIVVQFTEDEAAGVIKTYREDLLLADPVP